MKSVLLTITTFLLSLNMFPQLGCTDPAANNYNSTATYNDGSCTYNSINLTLTSGQNLPTQLNEISGMIYWNSKIYGHQDSGGPTSIFEVDPSTGVITKTINLQGVTNIDWEDITQDDTHFYICDVGNNTNGNRTDLKIYKFAKSLIVPGSTITIANNEIEVINFAYEDQTNFTGTGGNNTEFDCEAVAYNRGKLHLFTKNWIGNTTVHYVLPINPGTYLAERKGSYNTGTFKITGADFGAYDLLMLIGYETTGIANCALFLDYGFDGTYAYFNTGSVRKLDLGSALTLGQLEGVCFENALKGFVSNEYFNPSPFPAVIQQIKAFDITNLIRDYYEHNQINYNVNAIVPTAGVIRFNDATNKLEGYDGTHWNPFH